jgi:RNA polymerase sigma-70 factor, ECF subfamily
MIAGTTPSVLDRDCTRHKPTLPTRQGMSTPPQDDHLLEVEAPLREAFSVGNFDAATRLAFDLYGREVLSFLSARLRSDEHGQEAFAMFAEDLWTSMESFGWRCSMRCWVYILARNAANRYVVAPHRKPERNLPLSQHASALAVQPVTRDATRPYHDTEMKRRVRALRERLSRLDQTLLILHVDRGLPFRELAQVVQEGGDLLEGEELTREAARLRKRFERVKAQLRQLAIEEGILKRK